MRSVHNAIPNFDEHIEYAFVPKCSTNWRQCNSILILGFAYTCLHFATLRCQPRLCESIARKHCVTWVADLQFFNMKGYARR